MKAISSRNYRLCVIVLVGCLVGLLAAAEGQEIHGVVTDPLGAAVAGATVRLLSGGLEVASTDTDNHGTYSIGNVALCLDCEISFFAQGFATFTKEINLQAAQPLTLPVQLVIAVGPESISVSAKYLPFHDQLDVGDVRESTAKDVGEALAAVEGVYKIRKAGIANDVVIRGFQQGNLNVIIDGARIFAACPGHMDPAVQHVDFAEVDHVNVNKGAFDVSTAGSLGGTIEVVTKTPPLGFHVTPSLTAGSFGFYNPSLTSSFGNNTFGVLAGYSFRASDPYKDGDGRSFLSYANYSASGLQQKAFQINTGWIESQFSPAADQTLTLAYTRQAAGLILYPYLTMDSDHDNADRLSLKYDVLRAGNTLRAIHAQAYFTQVGHFMSDDQRTSAMDGQWTMASEASTRAVGGQVQGELGSNLSIGFESYYRKWNVLGAMRMMGVVGPTNPTVPDVDTEAVGAFASYHHSFSDRLKLISGARWDHAWIATGAPNLNTNLYYNYHKTRSTGTTNDYLSGNVRLFYDLPFSMELFAGVGSNGRIPDAEERYINRASKSAIYVGNPSLPTVRNTDSTVGLIVHHQSWYIKPTLFYSHINNYILVNDQPLLNVGAKSPGSARSFTNVDARIYGGELAYSFNLPSAFSVTGGGAYARGTNEKKPSAGVLATNLPEMPPLLAWVALRYVYRNVYAEVGGTGVARQDLVDTDLKETPTPGYGLMNVKLEFTYHKMLASFMVDNLLNRYYFEHLSYYRDPFASGVHIPEPGRNFFVQLRYSF